MCGVLILIELTDTLRNQTEWDCLQSLAKIYHRQFKHNEIFVLFFVFFFFFRTVCGYVYREQPCVDTINRNCVHTHSVNRGK